VYGWRGSPKTFPVLVREGSRLSQMRFHRGRTVVAGEALIGLHASEGLVDDPDADLSEGVAVGVDLAGFGPDGLVDGKTVSLERQGRALESRSLALQQRLATREQALLAQFSALESNLVRLQGTGDSLSTALDQIASVSRQRNR